MGLFEFRCLSWVVWICLLFVGFLFLNLVLVYCALKLVFYGGFGLVVCLGFWFGFGG